MQVQKVNHEMKKPKNENQWQVMDDQRSKGANLNTCVLLKKCSMKLRRIGKDRKRGGCNYVVKHWYEGKCRQKFV